MKTEILTINNINGYCEMIPEALDNEVFAENSHSIGVSFAGTPSGVAIWKDDPEDSFGRLINLFVLPEARLLGIGETLLAETIAGMKKAGKEGITFKYAATGDRMLLAPFFNEMGIETSIENTPVGRITLKEAAKVIGEKMSSVKETGKAVSDLSGKDKITVMKWIEQVSGYSPAEYMKGVPESYVILKDDKVKSALLISREDKETISLDFAFSENPKDLMALIKFGLIDIIKSCSKETVLEMLLSTDAGKSLYEKLFGEADYIYPVASCRQKLSEI